jgi:hypothetical protein
MWSQPRSRSRAIVAALAAGNAITAGAAGLGDVPNAVQWALIALAGTLAGALAVSGVNSDIKKWHSFCKTRVKFALAVGS